MQFSHAHALAALAIIFGLYGSFGLYAWFSGRQATNQTQALDAQIQAQQKRIAEISGALGVRLKPEQVAAQVEMVKAYADEGAQLASLLKPNGNFGNDRLSPGLRTLASLAGGDVWLTSISVPAGGGGVSLSGKALRRAAVIEYADRLNQAFSQQGVRFTRLQLTAADAESDAKDGGRTETLATFQLN